MKDKLRHLVEAGRQKEASDLLPHVDDAPPALPRRWTARDQLAHLTAWRLIATTELNAVRTGGTPPDVAEENDVENAKIYARTHDQKSASVLDEARHSLDLLLAAVEACSEEDLEKPRTHRPEQPAWQIIPGNTYFHVAQHLGYWSSERGDEAPAEEAAKWAHELATKTFPEDRRRGVADYNLGCFYAVRGRSEDAMPYLRSAFELRPDLREWAKEDTDLDAIRSDPELTSLLG